MTQPTDLPKRLRGMHSDLKQGAIYRPEEDPTWDATPEAADRIEELEAERDANADEVERLRASNRSWLAKWERMACEFCGSTMESPPSEDCDQRQGETE